MPEPELDAAEVRRIQLDVLAGFDAVCRSHGLTYYLAYGTLLGAIRHQGFIPWDDDVDVMMPRADYDRLPAVFAAAAPPLVLDSVATRADWPFPFAKVGDGRTELWEPLGVPLPMTVNIDVFPVDALPAGRLDGVLRSGALRLLRWAVELRYIAADRSRAWHSPLALRVGQPLVRRLPARALANLLTRAARTARGGGRVGVRVGTRVGSVDWSVPAAALGAPAEVRFEHLRGCAPADAGAVLTAMYGDWRQLPPESERISHHDSTARWLA